MVPETETEIYPTDPWAIDRRTYLFRLFLLIFIGLPIAIHLGHRLCDSWYSHVRGFPEQRPLYELAQQQVLARLKCPRTAVFPPLEDPHVNVLVLDERHESLGDFTVDSYVDAQNGFGAMVRLRWHGCFLRDGRVFHDKLSLEQR